MFRGWDRHKGGSKIWTVALVVSPRTTKSALSLVEVSGRGFMSGSVTGSQTLQSIYGRGFTTGQLDDLHILLAEGPSFRGPHVDGYPEKPVMATLPQDLKLVFSTGSAIATRFLIRRGWTIKSSVNTWK